MPKGQQLFGGGWTQEKLDRVRKYLVEYVKALKHQPFQLTYIDAFAGTGYRDLKVAEGQNQLLLPELAEKEPLEFLEGSASIALGVKPPFHRYIFIEKSPRRFAELDRLPRNYPHLADRIQLVNEEANEYLVRLCAEPWEKEGRRAVAFLDPFGMQVRWPTIEALARTRAVDTWILFPLGVAVNRLLTRSGEINAVMRTRLDDLFGTPDWYDAFYETSRQTSLFGADPEKVKTADFRLIGDFFVKRLKAVFAGVAENPHPLRNSRNIPLYLLCFAAGNPKGAPIALRIAEHILKA